MCPPDFSPDAAVWAVLAGIASGLYGFIITQAALPALSLEAQTPTQGPFERSPRGVWAKFSATGDMAQTYRGHSPAIRRAHCTHPSGRDDLLLGSVPKPRLRGRICRAPYDLAVGDFRRDRPDHTRRRQTERSGLHLFPITLCQKLTPGAYIHMVGIRYPPRPGGRRASAAERIAGSPAGGYLHPRRFSSDRGPRMQKHIRDKSLRWARCDRFGETS